MWLSILNKVAIAICSTIITTLLGVLFSKIFAKMNNSKIYKYAQTLVEAAEQKFPNEGTKMGPQKEAYVMGQLAIKFPKIRDSRYLYNIVLQCVYELNTNMHQENVLDQTVSVDQNENVSEDNDAKSKSNVSNNKQTQQINLQKKRPSSF